MITLCWGAKGGSGTTVAVATMALTATKPVLVVDLGGDIPITLGIREPSQPGLLDWLASDAPAERLDDLLTEVTPTMRLLHRHAPTGPDRAAQVASAIGDRAQRGAALAVWLTQWSDANGGDVLIDAGTGEPEPALCGVADHRYLVTRACYVALRRAARQTIRPTGVIVLDEGGRALQRRDIEVAVGARVIATLDVDPALARAADAGMLTTRIPHGARRTLQAVA
jgi:hypothetical protein